ncbi:hypothetical protein CN601_24955 [Bacillus sp. AFS017336]|nr:hypothetical protein CN692_16220 [Bacillus sp. AFS002410]PEK98829.1 hypothetical protein CN601_24955 [Bacillus sp. AFS017336]
MFEMISAVFALIAAHILFDRSNFGRKITPWASIGISILAIGLSIVVFVLIGSKFVSIIIITTVFCSVFVSTRYRAYVTNLTAARKL